MQSRVVALGVSRNHSMSIFSSNSPSGAGPVGRGFRFLGLGPLTPLAVLLAAAPETSSALRLFMGFGIVGEPLAPAPGLVGKGIPLSGLLARLTLADLVLGPLGLVARLATTECPPKLGIGAGEAALEPAAEASAVGGLEAGC